MERTEKYENLKKNAEGYDDPTAYEAIKNVDSEQERFNKLLHTIYNLCELSDFYVENRIIIRDKRTGKVYR